MSDSRGPIGDMADGGVRSAADVRTYILEMIDQLALMAAVHGHQDLVAALSAARSTPDPVRLN